MTRQVQGFAGASVLAAGPEVRDAWRFDALSFAAPRFAAPGVSGAHKAGTAVGAGPDDVALLATSSGTTGQSKIVVLTHRSMVANAWQISRAQHIGARDVSVALAPLFHVYGLPVAVLLARSPLVDEFDLSSLRLVTSAAAPLGCSAMA